MYEWFFAVIWKPILKIFDLSNLFVADAHMKYGSENRPCMRGLTHMGRLE